MNAQFLVPPILGALIVHDAKEGENPVRPCLLIAWDDHSENYLIADRETGDQSWRSLTELKIDCDSIITSCGIPASDVNQVKKQESDDDDSERCPVCKQPMP